MKKVINVLLILLLSVPAFAQEVEMADTMRSSGKIYVVVSILLIVLAGLIVYVVMVDRKVFRLEKRLEDKNH